MGEIGVRRDRRGERDSETQKWTQVETWRGAPDEKRWCFWERKKTISGVTERETPR